MRNKYCSTCGNIIIKERMEAMPETTVCVSCSAVKAKTVYDVEIDEPDKVELLKACTNQGDR